MEAKDLLSGIKMPKVGKFTMSLIFIVLVLALICAVFVAPFVLLYFVARFYHLRYLANIEKEFIKEEINERNSSVTTK